MMEIPSKKRKNLSTTASYRTKAPRVDLNPTSTATSKLDQEFSSSTSSCSSSGSDMRIQNVDLVEEEEEESGSVIVEGEEASMCLSERERKSETTAYSEVEEEDASSSEKLDSSTQQRRSNKNHKMPSESELEDFFSKAEQNLHKQFSNKYNYDVVKDVPLQGRYEWFKLNPSST